MLINVKLQSNFEIFFEHLTKKYGQEILELNGFEEDQLNYTSFIDKFTAASNTADATIDASANVFIKDICSLESEMNKSQMKLLAFSKIFSKIEKLKGLDAAQHWLENEWTGAYYLHDASSSTTKSYCYAYDLTQLAKRGLFFIENFSGGAPQHLTTFTDFVAEFVSFNSNRTSGACGLPDFLIWSFYFWKKDCENGYYIKSPEYYRDQESQRIIFKFNQPYLRKDQSAFTNVSIFDRPYLEAIFGGREYPDGTFVIDYIEEIIEYQKAFMKVCSETRAKNLMTFPVLTFSLLYKDDSFVDLEFARWACAHNMRWNDSNFYCSESVTSLSNCCLAGEQEVLIDAGYKTVSRNIPIGKLYNLLPEELENLSVYHDGRWVHGKLIRSQLRPFYKITTTNDDTIIVTDNHLNPTLDGDKVTTDLTTNDYLKCTKALTPFFGEDLSTPRDYIIKEDYVYQRIAKIKKFKSEYDYSYCFEMPIEDPYFTLANGIITHNCRLLSDIKDLYFNSIGGTALEVGSVKVNTINLARIAYESEGDKDRYLEIVAERAEECLMVLEVIRGIIQRNIEKGLLPNYSHGLISLKNQYSTIGIIGVYETLKYMGLTLKDDFDNVTYTTEGVEFMEDILAKITEVKKAFTEGKDYSGNIEQVPAERCAAILQQKDFLLYPDEVVDDLPLYGNQWIPLGIKSTLYEKISLSAILDKACSGGSIAHINLDAPLTDFNQAWQLLNLVASEGVPYSAFNVRINACEHNHGFFGKTCPICGGGVKTTWARIVG